MIDLGNELRDYGSPPKKELMLADLLNGMVINTGYTRRLSELKQEGFNTTPPVRYRMERCLARLKAEFEVLGLMDDSPTRR